MTKRLDQKIALITGAAQGIGATTAQLFVEAGAQVILSDIQDEKGQALAKQLGSATYYQHLDVQDEQSWESMHDYLLQTYGRLDILLNNAGITGLNQALGLQDPEHCSLKTWQTVHHINLNSVFLGCKYTIPWMKKQGGSIINMSSRSGLIGVPHAAAYASSKAAIINYTKTVALYCAEKRYPIRCNAVLPGAILTPIWDSMLGSTTSERALHLREIEAGIPLGHMGKPLDVAYAVLYFASDESCYVTGSTLNIDGGFMAGSFSNPVKPVR